MVIFLTGLVVMNTVMTASACGLFRSAAPYPRAAPVFIDLTASYSFIIGCVFLLDSSNHLPPLG
jgi:high-affinity nickel-transport protein